VSGGRKDVVARQMDSLDSIVGISIQPISTTPSLFAAPLARPKASGPAEHGVTKVKDEQDKLGQHRSSPRVEARGTFAGSRCQRPSSAVVRSQNGTWVA
jgi:hypothetical protein